MWNKSKSPTRRWHVARAQHLYRSGLMLSASNLRIHSLPELYVRAPDTAGPLTSSPEYARFIDRLIAPTGARVPTALVVNLEGRFPSASVVFDLVVRLGKEVTSRKHGEMSLVLATPDPALASVIRALAEANDVSLFVAQSVDDIESAEPVGRLTAADLETLRVLSELGGRASVGSLAKAAAIDHTAAGNRLATLDKKQLVLRVDRPKRQGNVYLDPRIASASARDEPLDPLSPDANTPSSVVIDARALASLQRTEKPKAVAEGWREFLEKHADEMARQHAEAAKTMRAGGKPPVKTYATRQASSGARSRSRRAAHR